METNLPVVDKIPFTNPFMFSLVMQNKDIFLEILRLIIPEENFTEVRKVEYAEETEFKVETEATLKFAAHSHGVRFDAFAKSTNAWAEIEMQTYSGTDLARRSRYYQGNMDIEALRQGCNYKDLPRSFVIFICTFDYPGSGEPLYYFQNYDIKNNLKLGDDSYKIILNTKCEPEKVPEKLKPLFDYIENRCEKNDNELIDRIDNEVIKYSGSEWRMKFVTLDEIREWEYDKGKMDVLLKLIDKGRMSVSEAAEEAGFEESALKRYIEQCRLNS